MFKNIFTLLDFLSIYELQYFTDILKLIKLIIVIVKIDNIFYMSNIECFNLNCK